MPHISELKDSKYLTKADVTPPKLLTIRTCEQRDLAMQGQPPDMKWILMFEEEEKGMVLNSTNGQIIASITGCDNTDDWPGHQIVLYNDPNIQFQGRLTGGIRARAPRRNPAAKTAPVAAAPRQAALKPAARPLAPTPMPAPEPEPEYDPTQPATPEDEDVPF